MCAALSSHLNLFAATDDPRRYVARPATEAALDALEARVVRDAAPATLLGGAAGTGKSLLLRVLAQRLRGRMRVASLPALDVDAAALCTMLLDVLKIEPDDDAERALLFHAAHLESRGSALVLLIDDAQRLPLATAGRLGALAEASAGLRIVAAATLDCDGTQSAAPLVPVGRALGATRTIALDAPLALLETIALVRAALVAGHASPAVRALFAGNAIARIHAEGCGVPGEVVRIAARVADRAVREGTVPEPGRAHWQPPAR